MMDNKAEECEIKLALHHNYLQIEKKDVKLQLPIRCAKILHDMYEIRQADNEDKDIAHYTEDYNNFSYSIKVMLMGVKYPNPFKWFSAKIKKFELEKKR